MVKAGCVKRLCALIDEYASLDYKSERRQGSATSSSSSSSSSSSLDYSPSSQPSDKRQNSGRNTEFRTRTALSRGVGYGSGSTKSRWDVERTVEERIAQEEHLVRFFKLLCLVIKLVN